MFQRIKGAIDRTIAEEQARARDQSPGATTPRASSSVSRSNSGASTVKRARSKKPGQDAAAKDADAGAADTDPAVFEAAFVIDDDEPSQIATPTFAPSHEPKNAEDGNGKEENTAMGEKGDTGAGNTAKDPEKNGEDEGSKSEGDKPVPPPKATTTADLPPDVRAKLRKLDKLEKTYPG